MHKMLKGAELLAKVKELGETDRNTLLRECGYTVTKKDGTERFNVIAFHEALIAAKGVTLPPPPSKTRNGGGKKLSFTVKVTKAGTCPLSAGYMKILGLEHGDEVVIEQTDRGLLLRGATTTPVACPAPTAITTTPVAITEPVRELTPF